MANDLTEEKKNELLENEDALIKNLILGINSVETDTIEIYRSGNLYLRFDIRAVSEEEINACREKHTTYERDKKRFGRMRMPVKTDTAKYRSDVIITATTDEWKKKLWNNRKLLDAAKVISSTDLVEVILRAGEKDEIYDKIMSLSGYNDNDDDEDEDSDEVTTIKN